MRRAGISALMLATAASTSAAKDRTSSSQAVARELDDLIGLRVAAGG